MPVFIDHFAFEEVVPPVGVEPTLPYGNKILSQSAITQLFEFSRGFLMPSLTV